MALRLEPKSQREMEDAAMYAYTAIRLSTNGDHQRRNKHHEATTLSILNQSRYQNPLRSTATA